MSNLPVSQPKVLDTGAGADESSQLQLDVQSVSPGDAVNFRAALERHMSASSGNAADPVKGASLGDKMMGRVSGLSDQMKEDQQHVSKMLEQASRSGDPMQLMKAMTALDDYQMKVQTIAKTVGKVQGAFDQLTKLQ